MKIRWNFSNFLLIENVYLISMIVTSINSFAIKTKIISISILIIKSSVLFLIKKRIKIKIRNVTVYANKTMMLESKQKINMSMIHRFLSINKIYLFESTSRVNLIIDQMIIVIQIVITDDQNVIFINNFDKTKIKIKKKKIIEYIFNLSFNAKSTIVNFCFVDVFTDKYNTKLDMFFLIQFLDEFAIKNADISDHWRNDYKTRVQEILNRHKTLFRDELNKFNDDIEMLIFFQDESNVSKFKQNFYFLTTRNRKTMNEILNFLVTQDRIQKISLKMFFATIFSVFVIWKNEKSKVIVDFKKINTRLYSNVYFLSRQNIILSVLNDFIVFFFVNFIKKKFNKTLNQSIDEKLFSWRFIKIRND